MPSKTDINPQTGKMYIINPQGVWDDNWWAQVVEPQLKQQYGVISQNQDTGTQDTGTQDTGTGSTKEAPTAEEYANAVVKAQQDKIKEQLDFMKDFTEKNPFAFDEILARQMAEQKYKPYYQQVLNDFVEPLQTKIARSTADETKLLGELVRRKGVGTREIQDTTQQAIDRSREGFAGTGLLGSGIESGVTGRQGIAGQNKLNDFLAENEFRRTDVTTNAARTREDANKAIAQKQRDIFGQDRAYETSMAQDVTQQRSVAERGSKLRTLDAIASRFGSPVPEIPNYLNLYNV